MLTSNAIRIRGTRRRTTALPRPEPKLELLGRTPVLVGLQQVSLCPMKSLDLVIHLLLALR